MKIKLHQQLLCFASILSLSSCQIEETLPINTIDYESYVVLQERNKEIPLSISQETLPRPKRMSSNSVENLLGTSYNLRSYPVTNANNIGFPVINYDSLNNDHPGFFSTPAMNSSQLIHYAFSTYSQLQTLLEVDVTSEYGTSIDLGVFEFDCESKFHEIFSEFIENESESVFGYSSINFQKRKYTLNIPSSDVLELICDNYLSDDYLYMLHHTSADQFVDGYGQYVLKDYIIGGSAYALLHGRKSSATNYSETQCEAIMNNQSSLIWDIGGSNNETVTMEGTIAELTQDAFDDIYFSVCTNGGLPAYQINTSAQLLINDISINLTNWASSLSDIDNLVISDLYSSSFIPITSFIEEENLKTEIQSKITNGTGSQTLQEPKIKIMIYVDPVRDTILVTNSLQTRRGEDLCIRRTIYPLNTDNSIDVVRNKELLFIQNYFPDIQVVSWVRTLEGVIMAELPPIDTPIIIPRPIVPTYDEFDIRSMRKFIDSKYGKLYLLCETNEGEQYAYTLYDDDIINDYTFEEYIDSLDYETELSLDEIQEEYILIAL